MSLLTKYVADPIKEHYQFVTVGLARIPSHFWKHPNTFLNVNQPLFAPPKPIFTANIVLPLITRGGGGVLKRVDIVATLASDAFLSVEKSVPKQEGCLQWYYIW